MHVGDTNKVELAAYQHKGVARLLFDQWMKDIREGAVILTWTVFDEAFFRNFFPRELREDKVKEFLNLKQGSMTVQDTTSSSLSYIAMLQRWLLT